MEWKINDDAVNVAVVIVNVVEIVGGVGDTKNRSSISKAFVSVDNLSKSFELFLSFWFLQKKFKRRVFRDDAKKGAKKIDDGFWNFFSKL